MVTITPWGGLFFGMGKNLYSAPDQEDADDIRNARQFSPVSLPDQETQGRELVGYFKHDPAGTLVFSKFTPPKTGFDNNLDTDFQPLHTLHAPDLNHHAIDTPPIAPLENNIADHQRASHDNTSLPHNVAMNSPADPIQSVGNSFLNQAHVTLTPGYIASTPAGAQPMSTAAPAPATAPAKPEITVLDTQGLEDGKIALSISVKFAPGINADDVHITLHGIPAGATLSSGSLLENGDWL